MNSGTVTHCRTRINNCTNYYQPRGVNVMKYAFNSTRTHMPARRIFTDHGTPKGKLFYLLSTFVVGLALMVSSAWAVDLTALTSIGGPLASALTQIDSLTPGIKALIGVIGFIVAFIALAAARNASPVLFYVMMLIFGAVGLPIGGAILGAVI
jgi:hypothetical protein